MKTRSFSDELRFAAAQNAAVGAFNIFNYLSARAVIRAASTLNQPVILQTSASTVRKFGPAELGTMLRQLAWNAPVNVLIHLDHCLDLDLAKACVDSGWDGIMYDGSHLPFEENVKNCQEIAAYAHHRGVCVEGELGRIAGVEDELAVEDEAAAEATLDEALRFVQESWIDAFAPAIGTAHGVYKGTPKINYELVRQLHAAVDIPLVVHGGTGLPAQTFRRLIACGAAKINVSTAIKHAYIDGCRQYMQENQDKLNPIGFDQYLNCCIKDITMEHMKVFRGGENA